MRLKDTYMENAIEEGKKDQFGGGDEYEIDYWFIFECILFVIVVGAGILRFS
jgi:hypothetical protein